MGNNDLAIALGALVTVITGFYAIARVMLKQSSDDRNKDRDERVKLAAAIQLMAENSGKVAAEATLGRKVQEQGFKEAKERNGHLAELVIGQAEAVKAVTDAAAHQVIGAVQNMKVAGQTIEKQNVEHLHVTTEVVEKN